MPRTGDQDGYGLHIAGQGSLPRAQGGMMVNKQWNPFTLQQEVIPPYYAVVGSGQLAAAAPAPEPAKSRKGLSHHQSQKLQLEEEFNQSNPGWLESYGFAPTKKGLEEAIRAVGYEGNTRDTKAVQQFLINQHLQQGNLGLFEDLLQNYGMTRQGVNSGYGEDWDSFELDPEMNGAPWVKEVMNNAFADDKWGVRSKLMLQGLLGLPSEGGRKKDVSVVDYLNRRGQDASKEGRKKLAESLGLTNYNYSAADNMRLLQLLQDQEQKKEEGGTVSMRRSLAPVDRSMANIEAEKGETVWGDFDDDGTQEHFQVGGARHSAGGTPLQVPDGSFVFSDTRRLKIGGPVLAHFGKSADTKKKYTPAELAKQYDVNHYKEILGDPDSDKLDRRTAELMLENIKMKLGGLALVQEGMKGFPNGIPEIAMPVIASQQLPMAALGGSLPVLQSGGIPVYGGDRTDQTSTYQRAQGLRKGFNKFNAPWLEEFGYANTAEGLAEALANAGYEGDWNNVKDIQKFMINKNLDKGNTALFQNLLKKYGMTQQGIKEGYESNLDDFTIDPDMNQAGWVKEMLENVYADNMFGVRSGDMLKEITRRNMKPSVVKGTRYSYEPPIVKEPVKTTPVAPVPKKDTEDVPSPQFSGQPNEQMPWWSQDMINFGAAFRNRYGLNKYMPSYVSPDAVLPNAVYYDPTRALASNQEAAAAQNLLNSVYSGPQRFRAVGSNIQGQAMGNAATILGDYANKNVAVANQLAGIRSEIRNNLGMQKANALDTFLARNTTANQQYDNAVRTADNDVRTNLLSGMTNAQKTYWINRLNPYYRINPTSGVLDFKGGKGLRGSSGASSTGGNPMALYKSYFDQFMNTIPGADRAKAYDFAQRMTFGNKSRFGVDSDGDAEMSASSVGAMNPMAMAMLQQYGAQFAGG
jgi:hypothetical protein